MKILDYAVTKKMGIAFSGGAPSLAEKTIAQKLGGGAGGSGGGGVDWSQYTHALYNGVRLPKIPEDVLAEYPYAWIRNDGANGKYNLVFGKQPWYFKTDGNAMSCPDSISLPYYSIPIATHATATAWGSESNGGGTDFGIATNRTVLWSNHDIHNGTAAQILPTIYLKGTDPVPSD